MNLLKPFRDFLNAFKIIFTDKIILLLASIPLFIGLLGYTSFFYYIQSTITSMTGSWVLKYLDATSWIFKALGYFLNSLITISAYFLVNWTFVLFVSLIGSPFNDFISERVEKKITNKELQNVKGSFQDIFKGLGFTIFNESKKIILILTLSAFSFFLGLIPMLSPLSLILGSLLVSAQFVDYCWARHQYKIKNCLADIKNNFTYYLITGVIYFILINIPLINLLVPPLATTHLSKYFALKNKI